MGRKLIINFADFSNIAVRKSPVKNTTIFGFEKSAWSSLSKTTAGQVSSYYGIKSQVSGLLVGFKAKIDNPNNEILSYNVRLFNEGSTSFSDYKAESSTNTTKQHGECYLAINPPINVEKGDIVGLSGSAIYYWGDNYKGETEAYTAGVKDAKGRIYSFQAVFEH